MIPGPAMARLCASRVFFERLHSLPFQGAGKEMIVHQIPAIILCGQFSAARGLFVLFESC
jgi:hypothetical protein